MKPDKFLRSMVPSFEKARLKEDINLIREELNETTLPVYQNAIESLGKRRFEAKHIQEFEKQFKKDVNVKARGNFITVTHETLKQVHENLDKLEYLIDKHYEKDVFREGMTYLRVNLLQYLEAMSFFLRYSRRLLLWVYSSEINAIENSSEQGKELTEGELDWMKQHQQAFFRSIELLFVKEKDLERTFQDIPDVVANPENNQYLKETVGQSKLDPFQFNLIPVKLNPIYHIRMAVAEWQVKRYQAAQEEKRMLEFKLLQLEQKQKGDEDPKLQQQIEYHQGRLQKLNYKLNEMEEEDG